MESGECRRVHTNFASSIGINEFSIDERIQDSLPALHKICPCRKLHLAPWAALPLVRMRASQAFLLWLHVCQLMLPELVGVWASLPEATVVTLGTFRWVIYACIFGYYYPAIRGATPASKSLVLFVAVAIPEVVWLMSDELTMNELMLLVTARLGQAAVLCFGLSLFWERRLVQAAGLGWGRIRDFRALRGLATPVITVAIAAATTVATGLAGATLTSIVQPPEDPSQTPAPPGAGPK